MERIDCAGDLMKILSIKSRKHIVDDRNNAENVYHTKNFILFICATPSKNLGVNKKYRAVDFVRLGIIVSKKIHNKAVVRNLFRRRLKEAFRLINPKLFKNRYDYEIIARQAIFNASLNTLISDLEKCLKGEVANNVVNINNTYYSNKTKKEKTNLTKTSTVLNLKLK